MAIFSVNLRQSWDQNQGVQRKWSNVFFFEAPSSVAAAAAGVGLWTGFLRNAVRTSVFCYEVYATSLLEGDDEYTVQTMTPGLERGTLVVPTGEAYDPTVCIAVTIRASSGRPSRKYWRPGLKESDVVAGSSIVPALVAQVEAAFNAALDATPLVDPDGQALSSPVLARYSRRKFGRESVEGVPAVPTLPE